MSAGGGKLRLKRSYKKSLVKGWFEVDTLLLAEGERMLQKIVNECWRLWRKRMLKCYRKLWMNCGSHERRECWNAAEDYEWIEEGVKKENVEMLRKIVSELWRPWKKRMLKENIGKSKIMVYERARECTRFFTAVHSQCIDRDKILSSGREKEG